MKRTDVIDHPFDKEKFSGLLKRVVAEQHTLSRYCQAAQISYSYLNKYVNQKFDRPPVVSTIRKMAGATKAVSFAEFLDAAGYDPQKYAEGEIAGTVNDDYLYPVLMSFAVTDFSWQLRRDDLVDGEPLEILIEDAPIRKWYFIPVLKKSVSEKEIAEALVSRTELDSMSKVSFVTDNEAIFASLSSMTFQLFSLSLSVIKVSGGRIEKEEIIKTNQKDDSVLKVVPGVRFTPFVIK